MNNFQLAMALSKLCPNGEQWALNGDSLEGLVWLDDSSLQPSDQEILELAATISEVFTPSTPILTPEQKLEAAGLSVSELKQLLGIS